MLVLSTEVQKMGKKECALIGIKAIMTHHIFALTKEDYSCTELKWTWYTIDNKTEVLPSIKIKLIIVHLRDHNVIYYFLFKTTIFIAKQA